MSFWLTNQDKPAIRLFVRLQSERMGWEVYDQLIALVEFLEFDLVETASQRTH